MKKKNSHIIISYILLVLIQLPGLWQLEHVFDNDHGIVYQNEKTDFQNPIDNSCMVLHTHWSYVSWIDIPVISIPIFTLTTDNEIGRAHV